MTYSDHSIANAIILFGALQGMLLILFLLKKNGNSLTYRFFSLFLFSLVYLNLWYALYFMGIHEIYGLSTMSIPYPYEFLIGIGFYFYIKSYEKSESSIYQKEFFWFVPAFIYAVLEVCFYLISIQEDSNRIYLKLESSGFFLMIEYIRFIFNIILGVLSVRFLNKKRENNNLSTKDKRKFDWLFLFSKVFIVYNLLSLLLTIFTFLLDQTSILALNLFYLTFFINTIFIYWIGYIGFTKYNIILPKIGSTTQSYDRKKKKFIEEKLNQVMEIEELFTNKDFSLPKLALATKISHKELSDYINTHYKCNVSEFINRYRVNKVKILINDSNFDHYTLEAISYEAGFNSKSSFNSIFKKHTGITPSQYKKSL
ncbi:helix-turn-helix domain-containing protein [Aquimarina litoralis]|uniref:helix-turn-helix domain-containing protein n=1 Tax=Aquimarina litoralis TaxID=584605 RepID=UPI001C571A45|nr:AraC family transcriptional regulator [Aquimarina litoralis]MBW1296323.1 helix-turn-helix domain-containing protein [Aquimarina litoralis]